MARDCVKTDAAPKSAFYSQAVKAAGLVFVSGQGAFDPVTGQIVGANIQEQTRQCLENLSAILSAAGTSLDRVVSTTFILRDPEDFAGMNEEWRSWFPVEPPARQGAKLPVEGPVCACRSASSQSREYTDPTSSYWRAQSLSLRRTPGRAQRQFAGQGPSMSPEAKAQPASLSGEAVGSGGRWADESGGFRRVSSPVVRRRPWRHDPFREPTGSLCARRLGEGGPPTR
jgi:2-iminobutanoate/2-iminopropanoate deaminase